MGHTANAFNLIAQHSFFGRQLVFVIHVLVVTAAADTKVLAARLNAIFSRAQHLDQVGAHEAALLFHHTRQHALSWQREGHEHRPPIFNTAHGRPPINQGG